MLARYVCCLIVAGCDGRGGFPIPVDVPHIKYDCDVLAQNCPELVPGGATYRCTWFIDGPGLGHVDCAPPTTPEVAEGESCGRQSPYDFDNCKLGLVCSPEKICRAICDLQNPTCVNGMCVARTGVFENPDTGEFVAGICE